jgi:homoserine kinase
MPRSSFVVSVPASSANLGPGFDAVGIALDLRVRADVKSAGHFSLRMSGSQAPSHDGYEQAILRAMHRIDGHLPKVAIHIENRIPLGKGLGSSAAASILGLIIAAKAHGKQLQRGELAALACELEGHPDNALAALYGGAVVAASAAADDSVRLRAPRGLHAVVIVPEIDLSTHDARALLPESYDRCDAVYTAQRASLLGAALGSGSWRALKSAMSDRLHQPYRAARIPGLLEALAVQANDLVGVALSGAGPSVLAIVRAGSAWRGVAQRMIEAFSKAGVAASATRIAFAARGAVVVGG